MIIFEFGGPLQRRPSFDKFGDFKRVMWLYFAVTHFSGGGIYFAVTHFSGGGINELIQGLAEAGVKAAVDSKRVVELHSAAKLLQ